jgi:ketosteroid isomerase-like protein
VSENLDLVRSIYADWERGDYSRADWADPDIEYVMADGPDPHRRRGLASMAETLRGALSPWEGASQRADDLKELDDTRVLVLNSYAVSGKTSGVSMRSKGANVFHIARGRVTKLVHYWDRDRALTDLGLKA